MVKQNLSEDFLNYPLCENFDELIVSNDFHRFFKLVLKQIFHDYNDLKSQLDGQGGSLDMFKQVDEGKFKQLEALVNSLGTQKVDEIAELFFHGCSYDTSDIKNKEQIINENDNPDALLDYFYEQQYLSDDQFDIVKNLINNPIFVLYAIDLKDKIEVSGNLPLTEFFNDKNSVSMILSEINKKFEKDRTICQLNLYVRDYNPNVLSQIELAQTLKVHALGGAYGIISINGLDYLYDTEENDILDYIVDKEKNEDFFSGKSRFLIVDEKREFVNNKPLVERLVHMDEGMLDGFIDTNLTKELGRNEVIFVKKDNGSIIIYGKEGGEQIEEFSDIVETIDVNRSEFKVLKVKIKKLVEQEIHEKAKAEGVEQEIPQAEYEELIKYYSMFHKDFIEGEVSSNIDANRKEDFDFFNFPYIVIKSDNGDSRIVKFETEKFDLIYSLGKRSIEDFERKDNSFPIEALKLGRKLIFIDRRTGNVLDVDEIDDQNVSILPIGHGKKSKLTLEYGNTVDNYQNYFVYVNYIKNRKLVKRFIDLSTINGFTENDKLLAKKQGIVILPSFMRSDHICGFVKAIGGKGFDLTNNNSIEQNVIMNHVVKVGEDFENKTQEFKEKSDNCDREFVISEEGFEYGFINLKTLEVVSNGLKGLVSRVGNDLARTDNGVMGLTSNKKEFVLISSKSGETRTLKTLRGKSLLVNDRVDCEVKDVMYGLLHNAENLFEQKKIDVTEFDIESAKTETDSDGKEVGVYVVSFKGVKLFTGKLNRAFVDGTFGLRNVLGLKGKKYFDLLYSNGNIYIDCFELKNIPIVNAYKYKRVAFNLELFDLYKDQYNKEGGIKDYSKFVQQLDDVEKYI